MNHPKCVSTLPNTNIAHFETAVDWVRSNRLFSTFAEKLSKVHLFKFFVENFYKSSGIKFFIFSQVFD